MRQTLLNTIVNKYRLEDIEKQLVHHYLHYNRIDYSQSIYLNKYFDDFVPTNELKLDIAKLNHTGLDALAMDMELLIPRSDQKINGAFFTPAYIVDYIIDTIHPALDARVADISCGSGAFLLGIIRYYKSRFNKPVSSIIKDNIYGADILSYNIRRAKTLLILYAIAEGDIINESDINIVCDNSLTRKWDINFDAIVGNPPYVKFQDLDTDTRKYLTDCWQTTKSGTFNLYFTFFELGLNLLKPNGKLGLITPNNYFTSLSGEPLRKFFHMRQSVYMIVDFCYTKVFDAQTYTAITFADNKHNNHISYARISKNQNPKEFINNIHLSDNAYTDIVAKKWRLLCDDERFNIENIENVGTTLGNLFNICVGIATLKDDAYFIDPIDEDEDCFLIQRDGQYYKIEKSVTRPLVKISDIKSQQDIIKNNRRIVFPYKIYKNKVTVIDENVFARIYPNCYKYLLSVKQLLATRDKGKHIYTPFYSYGRTQGLSRSGVKLLTPTFSQYPRFILDNNIDGLFTNGYGIYIEDKRGDLFESNPVSHDLDILQKILNSGIMHYYVSKTSVSIDGGYPCYQKNFIEKFSIPNLSESEIKKLKSISTQLEIDEFLIDKYHLNLSAPNLWS